MVTQCFKMPVWRSGLCICFDNCWSMPQWHSLHWISCDSDCFAGCLCLLVE